MEAYEEPQFAPEEEAAHEAASFAQGLEKLQVNTLPAHTPAFLTSDC